MGKINHMTEDQALLQTAREHLQDPDIILDMVDKHINWISEYGAEVLGKPREEIIDSSIYPYFAKISIKDAIIMGARDVLAKNGINEYPGKTKDGPMYLKLKFVIMDHNSITYYVGKLIGSRPIKKK